MIVAVKVVPVRVSVMVIVVNVSDDGDMCCCIFSRILSVVLNARLCWLKVKYINYTCIVPVAGEMDILRIVCTKLDTGKSERKVK